MGLFFVPNYCPIRADRHRPKADQKRPDSVLQTPYFATCDSLTAALAANTGGTPMKELSEMTVQELFKHKDQAMQAIENAQKAIDMDGLAKGRGLLKRIDAEITLRVTVGTV